jgi:hypothetical protein
MIVAATLLLAMALFCSLAWGLFRLVKEKDGDIVIESNAVAILLKFGFRIEYRSSGQRSSESRKIDGSTTSEPSVKVLEVAPPRDAQLRKEDIDR